MEINHSYKHYNIWTFIIFLSVVFLMFTIVFTTILQSSAGKLTFFFILFVLTLLTGGLLFLFSMNKSGSIFLDQAVVRDEKISESKDLSNVETNETVVEEILFDVNALLPVKTKSLNDFSDTLLRNMAREFNFVQGLLYVRRSGKKDLFTCNAQYACFSDSKPDDFKTGETLPGQAVKNKIIVAINNIPENYMPVVSGLGKGAPRQLIFVPCIFNDEVIALIEYATFEAFNGIMEKNLLQISEKVAECIIKLNKEI